MTNAPLLTVKEVAALLSVPSRTIHRWIVEQRIPAIRIARTFRIPSAALEQILDRASTLQAPEYMTPLSVVRVDKAGSLPDVAHQSSEHPQSDREAL